jgi:O-acetyl-ADP-ribose deacetylase (regulator of RNase III)
VISLQKKLILSVNTRNINIIIANAANNYLSHGGGVAGAISSKGGR